MYVLFPHMDVFVRIEHYLWRIFLITAKGLGDIHVHILSYAWNIGSQNRLYSCIVKIDKKELLIIHRMLADLMQRNLITVLSILCWKVCGDVWSEKQ